MKVNVYLIMVLVLASFIYAAPPSQVFSTNTLSDSLQLEVSYFNYHPANLDYKIKVHVFNGTSGYPLSSGISCNLHVYNESKHIAELREAAPDSDHVYDYEFTVNAANFTNLGYYHFIAQCNTSVIGGFYADKFEVTWDGNEPQPTTSFPILILLIPLAIAFFFIYWSNSLPKTEDGWDEPIKWFFRMFAIVMLYVMFIGVHMVIRLANVYPGLQHLFNLVAIHLIFWLLIALFILMTIFSVFMKMKGLEKNNLDKGVIK